MRKANANFVNIRLPESGNKFVVWLFGCLVVWLFGCLVCSCCFSEQIQQPNVSGRFYPADPKELSRLIEKYMSEAKPLDIKGDILVLISPHAGYEFSGRTAAYGYKAVADKHYDTIIILGPSHYSNFKGAALWSEGSFRTPLGKIAVDEALSYSLKLASSIFRHFPEAFKREHSIEVQLPYLQTVFEDFKIIPIALGNIDFSECRQLAAAITKSIKNKSCLLIASSDMYHGFDYQEGELKDIHTLQFIRQLQPRELYEHIKTSQAQLCGWAGVVISMLVAHDLGYENVGVLHYTNSAEVMNSRRNGEYCVGYSSVAIYKQTNLKGGAMLNEEQRKRLLGIARDSIENYLRTGRRISISESEPVLTQTCGAFVTLHRYGQLRGCIGNIIGSQPLYLTVRDMSVEAAVKDPRFPPVTEKELSEIEIEISVLSPLERVNNPDEIQMGKHGVLVKKGYRSGVFLPQVATETGWTKEEFLSNLCAHKAGLPSLAWKDASTELYIFTAEVFSE